MARVHLASGGDVIMPQLITNAREMADFESAAAAAEAEYCHILLAADVESSIERFMKRPTASNRGHETISKIVSENGGPDLLRKIHSQLTEFTAGKQLRSVINCGQQTAGQTCRAVEAALRPA
jgi:hypothetical protein